MEYIRKNAGLTAYSSDGSIYAVRPQRVGLPRSIDEICDAVKTAVGDRLSVTARGAGTGLVGGSLGDGLIMDFSRFREILEIDAQKRTVLTQVGIIYNELNRRLSHFDLFFPPDPSSGDSCQIGGMLAGNSSGPRSVKYGLTSQFVEELDIVSASGQPVHLQQFKLGSAELSEFFVTHEEYKSVYEILDKNRELIKQRWPRLKKNSAGYNLLQVISDLDRGVFNLPALMVGAEGTLGLISRARLRLLPCPQERLTIRLFFDSLVEAGRAVAQVAELGPSALEIVDGATLDLIGRERFDIPAKPAALLIVEFDDNLKSKKEQFDALQSKLALSLPADYAADPQKTALLWKARKAIVPTLYRHHPKKRPIALVEDVSLPTDKIPDFIEYVTGLFDKHNLVFGIFGHIGDGNLHLRPLFDLSDKNDFDRARIIYNEVYDKVLSLGGSTTAEHADGRLRAELVEKMYGAEIYALFRDIKALLDPDNILSPDSILSSKKFTEKIDLDKLTSYCAACGKCNGYCPAYDIFRREDFSPRGWLRILRQSGENAEELNSYLSYCLNCKNCTTVCPAGVDIAGEILKFRAQQRSVMSEAIVNLTDNESLLNLSLMFGRALEPLLESSVGKSTLAFLGGRFGFDKSTKLPKIARKSLRRRYAGHIADTGEVAFFHGCADNLFDSNTGDATFRVFDKLGLKLALPPQKCCGLPQEVYGHRENLIEKAKYNIERLNRFESVITGCASCLLRLKEYVNLFDPGSFYFKEAHKLAENCFDISQFLNQKDIDFSKFDSTQSIKVTYHHPCHLRAAKLQNEPLKLIEKVGGVKIITPEFADSCCGQAGSYGYTHYQEAKKIFEKKKEDFQNSGAEYIITSCPACRMKIEAEMNGAFKVVHPVEILSERIKKR